MKEKYLVVNAGSSSLKFSLYEMPSKREIVNGLIEKIGEGDSAYTLRFDGNKIEEKKDIKNHVDAVNTMLEALLKNKFILDMNEIRGVGHRVLHGGEFYSDSVFIDDEVLKNIESLKKFGPLHIPGELDGIRSMSKVLKDVPQVAVFDTAFHQTMPAKNYLYGVRYDLYEKYGIRKYGFHGTSYKYITNYMQKKLNKYDVNLVVCHIGSGASLCAIKNGESYDTSMGLTPLDGTLMGTRSGDVTPAIIKILNDEGMSIDDVMYILNNQSGLLGIAGKNDCRDVDKLISEGNEKAKLAMEMFEDSVVKYIAQYITSLDGDVDAIVFTAGIGENNVKFRENVLNKLKNTFSIVINPALNNKIAKFLENQTGKITSDYFSEYSVYVVPTDEESVILEDTYSIVKEKEKEIDTNITLKKTK